MDFKRMPTIAVLMTCHNRVNSTLECLAHLYEQTALGRIDLSVYLVDDGSSDGTGARVLERFPDVNVIEGDGGLFWNRGMHRAFGEALLVGFDYYLWLNDDTNLYPDALLTLVQSHDTLAARGDALSIVVASTQDPETGEFTYGGYRNTRGVLNRIGFRLVPPTDELLRCDAMCGNCVLIPREVAKIVGNIAPEFQHQWGDVDYGMRAVEAGCKIWVAPGYLAECGANPAAVKWKMPGVPWKERLAELHSVKGLGKRDWFRFVRRHAGFLWPLIWLKPYFHVLITSIK